VQLGPGLEKLTEPHDNKIFTASLKQRNLARLPVFIRNPEPHLDEIKQAYQQNAKDIPKIQQLLFSTPPQPGPIGTLHCRFQAVYGLVLMYSTFLNTLLCCFEPDNPSLAKDARNYIQEILTLAEDAMPYRPLGSSSMPLCLISAWIATSDETTRAKLEAVLAEYQFDYVAESWMKNARELERQLKKHGGARPKLLELPPGFS
jgi:hypothetical protein